MKTKNIILGIIVLGLIAYFVLHKKSDVATTIPNPSPGAQELCYYSETPAANGLQDVNALKLNIAGTAVTGELWYVPAEKDSKKGTLEGTDTGGNILPRTLDIFWNAMAEGMQTKEELSVLLKDGSASIGFGEMVDRGDGVYIYKDKSNLSYIAIPQASCTIVDDHMIVEQYVRDHIASIAPEPPVLGGTWFVSGVTVDPATKTGSFTYEDGHTTGKASFTYVRDGNSVILAEIKKV